MNTRGERQGSRDPRFAAWIGATALLFLFSVGVGFVWLPSAQPGADALDLWGSICRAVGLPDARTRIAAPPAGTPSTTVAWTPATRKVLGEGNAVRGAALATTCNNCHGDTGISADAIFPNLAGQGVAAIYKQLVDFKSGRRDPAVMGVYVAPLSTQDMLDLAAHYAALPNPFAAASVGTANAAARALIEVGNPIRGIAPCAACHAGSAQLLGAPGLHGQQRAYLEQQMQAFATGRRRNDISDQMRTVARQLTASEIEMLAAEYSDVAGAGVGRPPK